MSIYNQENVVLDAQPDTVYYFRKTPKEEGPVVYSLTSDGDAPFLVSQYSSPIVKYRIVLFLRNDACQGSLTFQVYDDEGHVIPGTSMSCLLSGTPLHMMDYTFDSALPSDTPVHFGLSTSSDFSTTTLTFPWINMLFFQQ